MRHGIAQVLDRNDPDSGDRRSFGRVGRRQHDLLEAPVAGRQGEAERSAHGTHLAAEAELADENARRRVLGAHAAEPEESERDGEVERRAALTKVGGSEIDGHGAVRQRKAAVLQGRANALARLPNARVGEPDDREAGKPVGSVDLDVENAGLETQGGGRVDPGEHLASSVPRRA